MSSLFGILGLGQQGLTAHGFGTQVSSNNATNVNTEGYSRRAPVLEHSSGTGVRASGMRRVIDPFLDSRLLDTRTEHGSADAQNTVLPVLDRVFGDGAGTLGESMDAFRSALRDWSVKPDDATMRAQVLSRAERVAASFRDAGRALTETANEIDLRIAHDVAEVNARAEQVAKLGAAIAKAEAQGREASDLRDRRDQLVREIADRVPVRVIESSDGSVSVLLAGRTALVSPDGRAHELTTQRDSAGVLRITRTTSGVAEDVTDVIDSGRVGGFIAARNGALASLRADLDGFAYDFASSYNAVHAAGVGLDGVSGRPLFEPPTPGTGAAERMNVSAQVAQNPEALAGALDTGALPGDNRGVLALTELDRATFARSGSATADEALAAMIGDAGMAVRVARQNQEQHRAALDQVQTLREAVSGVSTDDEMAALMRFQRGYQAALRVVETADQMLEELLQLKR